MTFQDLVRLTTRHMLAILVSLLTCVLLALGAYWLTPRVYQADSTGYVSAVRPAEGGNYGTSSDYADHILAQQKAKSYVPIINSRAVAERASVMIGGALSAASLGGNTKVELPKDSVAIIVKVSASDPNLASQGADAMVAAAAEEIKEIEGVQSNVQITRLTSAEVPTHPVSPNLKLYLAAGVFAGLILGYTLAFIRRIYDTTIRTVEDLEENKHISILGVMPSANEEQLGNDILLFDTDKDFQSREALRKLRTNLQFVDIDNPPSSVCVTSSVMGEGKSTVAANLAFVLAEAGQKVMLIDTDLRRPSIASKLELEGSVGLTQVLTGSVELNDALVKYSDNLTVLPAGTIPPNPSEILGSKRMKELLELLSEDYFIICDAPPVLPVTDAVLLSRATDGTIIVVKSGKATREQIERTLTTLERVQTKIFGFVLNGASNRRFDRFRYGHGEYGYAGNTSAYDQAYQSNTGSSAAGAEKEDADESAEKSE
ncbi:MAG: polysaccharide biosynthesis tyrosine autokinase [Actinomycetaceae bacterium]|nr:polysaccharide biosynthesis tyrosine autokinase [Actinomycetaceae bacterium]